MKNGFFLLIFTLLLWSCARVGSPVGGAKDTIAPKFLSANIDSTRVRVPLSLKELRLNFDEYVNIREVSKNLIISPPITKIKKILPSNLGNKYILIQWEDELQPNTTYNFNFGNAIVDLNEGNVLPYFNYVFSTGEKLDDLYISGDVVAGLMNETAPNGNIDSKKNYVVGLYKDSDSIDYRQKPNYITKADPDGYFEMNYLSPGAYRILAFNDENQNSIFDQGKEDVAFIKEKINLNKSISGMKLRLFPTKKRINFLEGKEAPGGVLLLFEGKPNLVQVTSQNEKLTDYKVTHKPKSDSVRIWFDAAKQNIGQAQSENLKFAYKADTLKGTASVYYRMNPKNELTIANTGSNLLAPNNDFVITANYPLTTINTEKWVMKADSTQVDFSAKISESDDYKIRVSANFQSGKKYKLIVPKGTVSSYYQNIAKSYQFNFDVDKSENYGSLVVNIQNKPSAKFWLQLLDEKGDVHYSRFTDATSVKFTELKPGRYTVRILVDNNGDGVWNEADFGTQTYAEEVYLFPKTIEVRPLWENVESWDLNSENKEKNVK